MTFQQQLESGISHHKAGRLVEAEKIYRRILAQDSNQPDTLHLLGLLAGQVGQLDAAVELIQQAIRIKPDYAEAYNNLGKTLERKGQPDEAITAYMHATTLNPNLPEAQSNLGNALAARGRFGEAVIAYRNAVALTPNHAAAYSNLGIALNETGQLDAAIAAFHQAIALEPNLPGAHSNLGNALKGMHRLDEAIAAYRRAIALSPGFFQAHSNLADALRGKRRLDESIAACRQAIALNPDFPEAFSNLGSSLADNGQLDEAIAVFRQAIRLKPDLPKAQSNLGNALKDVGQLDEAVAAFRQAVQLGPDDPEAHGNLLFSLNYHPDMGAEEIVAEHRAWSIRNEQPLMSKRGPFSNERAPDRRLRIAYISADFRHHSVGYFLLPLLEHHDRRSFEILCYANVLHPDNTTERMKRSCDVWRDIVGVQDDAVAEMVRSDRIDILVDLSGHTAGNRLRVFARKPAPIQITYLGYPNTTGMMAMDYRLTDSLADPPGMTDHLNVEKLWRLPTCAWCYEPAEDAPDIRPREDGPITFGCFNAFAKVNSSFAATWAELLNHVPGSRLLLKSTGAPEASARQRLTGQFAAHGISGERIEMIGRIPDPRRHLELYHRVDIALDTYPYHGTTTSCEAMWMGLPVVSLAGQTHVSRVGVSLLSNVGLPELIAKTPQQYVEFATSLAKDLPRLADLRRTLRSRMQASPLMDAPRFAGNVEAAYRQMWRTWCETAV